MKNIICKIFGHKSGNILGQLTKYDNTDKIDPDNERELVCFEGVCPRCGIKYVL